MKAWSLRANPMAERWDETWHRLREWTNGQGPSERLAAQILLDAGYEGLDPSHPLGGKDGGMDAVCHKSGERWIMAVYFPRGQQNFATIKQKFLSDVVGITANAAIGIAFVTNQELRLAEREELSIAAAEVQTDLFHLERITALLDRPTMARIRKQFLNINEMWDARIYAEALPKTNSIVGQAEGMLRELGRAAGREIDPDTIGLPEIKQMCQAVDPNSPAPLIARFTPDEGHVYASWIGYLCHWRSRSAQFAKDVLVFSPFLEPEHVVLIARVEQCSYFVQLASLSGVPLKNSDMSWLASSIWEYVRRARELKVYAQQMKAKIEA